MLKKINLTKYEKFNFSNNSRRLIDLLGLKYKIQNTK